MLANVMHRLAFFPVLTASIVLAACGRPQQDEATPVPEEPAPTAEPQRANATPLRPLPQRKYGGEITEKESTPLHALVKHPAQFSAKTVRTEGVVVAVCKAKGCWMELSDEAGFAHIKMANHSFFVPRTSTGHRAVIQGRVVNAPKDHCTEEAEEATGAVAKVEIEATAVEFVD
jgi:hypothetical protein